MLLEDAKREKKRLQHLSERNSEGINIEYLKNVVIKYIESGNGIEKDRLIPVIATLLHFRWGRVDNSALAGAAPFVRSPSLSLSISLSPAVRRRCRK